MLRYSEASGSSRGCQILHEVCSLPTAPFVEDRVIAYARAFAKARKLKLTQDRFGNVLLELRGTQRNAPRWVYTAHADHPGFVAERMLDATTLQATFRGWVLTALRTRHRTGFALFLSGLLFALVHLDPVRFTAVLALGALFAWLAWRAGSVWPAVVAHLVNNSLGVAMSVSGAGGEGDLVAARAHVAQVALLWVGLLAAAGAILRGLALAYLRATPEPPPVEAALAARPGEAPGPFRWSRVPRAALLAFLVGILALCAIAATGKR